MDSLKFHQQLLPHIRKLFQECKEDDDCKIIKINDLLIKHAIRIRWKTNDDPKRTKKTIDPIIIKIPYETVTDIQTETDLKRMISKISSYAASKRRNFAPTAPQDINDSVLPQLWVFPQ